MRSNEGIKTMLSNEDIKMMLKLSWLWRRAGASWTSVGEIRESIKLDNRTTQELLEVGKRVGAFEVSAGRFYRVQGGRAANAARDRAIDAMLAVGPTPRTCFFDHFQHTIDTRLCHRTQSGTIAAQVEGKYTVYTRPGSVTMERQHVTADYNDARNVVVVKAGEAPVLELFLSQPGRGGYTLVSSRSPWTEADHFIGQVKTVQNWLYAARTAAVIAGQI